MITRLDGHLDACLLPPVETGADREDDPLLRRRVVRAWRDDEPGTPHPVLVELLDHDLIEERPKLVPNGLNGLTSRTRFHGDEDNRGRVTNPARICHLRALSGEGK